MANTKLGPCVQLRRIVRDPRPSFELLVKVKRDDRGGFNDRGPRTESRGDTRPSFSRDSSDSRGDSRGNRDSAPRESNGNSAGYAGRSERPSGDRPRSFGDRNAGGDRSNSDRSRSDRPSGDRSSAAPNRSFGDSVAFGKKPFPRDGASAPRGDSNRGDSRSDSNRGDNRGNRPDAPRGDNRVLGQRYEGRSDAPRGDRSAAPARRDSNDSRDSRPSARPSTDTRSFGNANAGSGAPRRPRSFA